MSNDWFFFAIFLADDSKWLSFSFTGLYYTPPALFAFYNNKPCVEEFATVYASIVA